MVSFEEKPDPERAAQLLKRNYFWNSGISIWKVSKLLNLIQKYTPDHYAALKYVTEETVAAKKLRRMEVAFKDLERTAIDHAIFEKAENLFAIPVDLKWHDIGSWRAVYDIQKKRDGNVTRGAVVSLDTEKCLIYSHKRLIATLGVSDLIIVETADAILIAHKDETDRLKELYAKVRDFGGDKYL